MASRHTGFQPFLAGLDSFESEPELLDDRFIVWYVLNHHQKEEKDVKK
jgi:hypothetical protein